MQVIIWHNQDTQIQANISFTYIHIYLWTLFQFENQQRARFISMSSAEERTQKLLILAGDEDHSFQARDFSKMVSVIVKEYLTSSKPIYEQFLLEILTGVIRRVPLKYHMYAGLTAEIQKVNPQLAKNIIKNVVANLQKDLNSLKVHESINGILYLSELMNLQMLNSLCFFNLLDDIMTYIENTKNSNHRQFFVTVFSRTLHDFCFSLNKKVYFDFKKLLERAKKFCTKSNEFNAIFEAQQRGNLSDGSFINRIYTQQNPPHAQNQIQQQLKLKIQVNHDLIFTPIQYYFPKLDESEKLYEEFQRNQSWIHVANIEQIIQLMKQSGTFMIQKLLNYIKFESQKTSFMQRFAIDSIIGKALKSKNSVIQSYILVKLIQLDRVYAELVESALTKGLNFDNEAYDLSCQMKFAEVLSYIITNWPGGKDDMTDIGPWDWSKFLSSKGNQEQNFENDAKRSVLLKIICHKLELLSAGYNFTSQLKKYAPREDLKSPTKYNKPEEIEKVEIFQNLLAKKASAEEVLPNINSETDYQIFLQALFEKTSQSHTHLEVLIKRYQEVFKTHKQDYDWTLLNTIRSYWSRSLFHRLLYLENMIEKGFVDFESYVKYIGEVDKDNKKTEEESQWVRIELNELHNLFASRLAK